MSSDQQRVARDEGKPYDIPAFRMIDDIYYVGGYVGSFLITSEDGHILIDTTFPGQGAYILKGIVDLGFKPKDVKHILITHAHFDHTGNAMMLAEATGAKVCIGEFEREAAEKGSERHPAITIDESLKDGDIIAVGNKEIRVYHTPGHTIGNISFGFNIPHENQMLNTFIVGGFAVGNRARYEGALQDYKKTLERYESLNVDVWLVSHPEPNDTFGKFALLRQGVTPNPYIDPDGWKAFLQMLEESLRSGKELSPWIFPLYTRQQPYFLSRPFL